MKAINLKETDLIAVVVPLDACNAYVTLCLDVYVLCYKAFGDEPCVLHIGIKSEVLGSVTKDLIDFDVSPYIEIEREASIKCYKDYSGNKNLAHFSKHSSFRSLLTANGVLFENPYNDKMNANPEIKGSMVRAINRMAYQDKWQQAESQLTPKVLILKKLK